MDKDKAAAGGTTATTSSGQPIVVNLIQPDRAAEGAQAMADGRALNMDETVPGGRYSVNGVIVDANGEPVKGGDKAGDKDA